MGLSQQGADSSTYSHRLMEGGEGRRREKRRKGGEEGRRGVERRVPSVAAVGLGA